MNPTRQAYNDRSYVLGDALRNMDGPTVAPPWRLREILKEFAKLSPRDHSPTNDLSVDEIYAQILEAETTSLEHYEVLEHLEHLWQLQQELQLML